LDLGIVPQFHGYLSFVVFNMSKLMNQFDYEKNMDLWLANLTGEQIFEFLADNNPKDFNGLAKIFNTKQGHINIGRWLHRHFCNHIDKQPEFWEEDDECDEQS